MIYKMSEISQNSKSIRKDRIRSDLSNRKVLLAGHFADTYEPEHRRKRFEGDILILQYAGNYTGRYTTEWYEGYLFGDATFTARDRAVNAKQSGGF